MTVASDIARAGEVLAQSMSSAFADMCFLDARPVPRATSDILPEIRAVIDALKPTSWRIELRLPASLQGRMREILFPDGAGVAGEEDAVLELLNVAAGAFLTGYFGRGQEIKLALPRLLYFGEACEGTELASFVLDVEGVLVGVWLYSVRYRY